MDMFVKRFSILCFFMLLALPALAVSNSYEWVGLYSSNQVTTGTNWCDGLNWSNITSSTYNDGYPDGVGDFVLVPLTNTLTRIVITSNITVGVVSNVSDNSAACVQYYTNSGTGAILTMDNGAAESHFAYVPHSGIHFLGGDVDGIALPVHINGDFRYTWDCNRVRFTRHPITGTGDVYYAKWSGSGRVWRIGDTEAFTYVGDTYLISEVDRADSFSLKGDDVIPGGNLYIYADYSVTQTGAVQIVSSGGIEDRIADSCTVWATNKMILDLNSGVTETVNKLYFDGKWQTPGTWGSSSSAADNVNDNFFQDTGVLTVLSGPVRARIPRQGRLLWQ